MGSSRRAVVVGVDKYQDSRIPELYGAGNDAEELCDKLREYGKFEIDAFLKNEQADYLSVRKALSRLLWRADKQALSLFYFSGHGFQDDYGYGYIAPWDLAYDEPLVKGLRMQELKDLLLKAKNKDVVIAMLDCCYSGIAAEGGGDRDLPGNGAASLSVFQGMDKENAGAGRIVLASSGKDQKSREIPECVHGIGDRKPHYHGAFTFQLLEALDGAGAGAQGMVTLADLQGFVDAHMDADRRPSYFSSGLHDARSIVIAEASQLYSINEILAAITKKLDQDDGYELFLAVDMLSGVLEKAPNLAAAQDLKRRIDLAIDDRRTAWMSFLQNNTMRIVKSIGVAKYLDIKSSAANASFESLRDGSTWGELGDLCSVAQGKMTFEAYVGTTKASGPIESPPPAANRTPQSVRPIGGLVL